MIVRIASDGRGDQIDGQIRPVGLPMDQTKKMQRIRVLRIKRSAARYAVFSGVGKTVPEMELALKAGILLFNVESASELRVLAAASACRVQWIT